MWLFVCVMGQHVFDGDVSFSEGLTAVRTYNGGGVAAMQHLVASLLRLLAKVVPTVCALILLIQLVFVIQVTSQVLVTKFPLAEAHPTVMAPKQRLVCVGLSCSLRGLLSSVWFFKCRSRCSFLLKTFWQNWHSNGCFIYGSFYASQDRSSSGAFLTSACTHAAGGCPAYLVSRKGPHIPCTERSLVWMQVSFGKVDCTGGLPLWVFTSDSDAFLT